MREVKVLIGSCLPSVKKSRIQMKICKVKQVWEQEGFPGYLIPVFLKHILYLKPASPFAIPHHVQCLF